MLFLEPDQRTGGHREPVTGSVDDPHAGIMPPYIVGEEKGGCEKKKGKRGEEREYTYCPAHYRILRT